MRLGVAWPPVPTTATVVSLVRRDCRLCGDRCGYHTCIDQALLHPHICPKAILHWYQGLRRVTPCVLASSRLDPEKGQTAAATARVYED